MSRPGRGGLRRTWAIGAFAAILPVSSALPLAGQRVAETQEGSADGTPTAEGAWRIRGTSREALRSGVRLAVGDSIGMVSPWVVHVELGAGDFGEGKLSLATEVVLEDDGEAMGPRAEPEGSSFTIEASPCGGQRIRVHRGALMVKLWPADHPVCAVAVGARLENRGTAYGLRVDGAGTAYLGVTEDSVAILWYGRGAEREAALPCDGDPDRPTPCVQVAPQGTLWSWSHDRRPTREEEDEAPPFPFESWAEARADAVNWMGRDIYDDFAWWPVIGVAGAAVAACILFDVWPCGGDASGDVILVP